MAKEKHDYAVVLELDRAQITLPFDRYPAAKKFFESSIECTAVTNVVLMDSDEVLDEDGK